VNPRQRRGVIFMLLAGVTALVLFIVAVNYVGSVNSKVSPETTVYKASRPIEAYAVISKSDLTPVKVPERWISPQAIKDENSVVGRRVSFNLSEGTYLGTDMLLPPSALQKDEREIALTVDAKTGIAGRVRTGDRVDVYAVFGDDVANGTSKVLVRGVRVVSVRGVETRTKQTSDSRLDETQVIPVTLALNPTASLSVTYADAFATSVRLVGLAPDVGERNRSSERSQVDGKDLGLKAGDGE
jgi:pilus assembly protein CpaB